MSAVSDRITPADAASILRILRDVERRMAEKEAAAKEAERDRQQQPKEQTTPADQQRTS